MGTGVVFEKGEALFVRKETASDQIIAEQRQRIAALKAQVYAPIFVHVTFEDGAFEERGTYGTSKDAEEAEFRWKERTFGAELERDFDEADASSVAEAIEDAYDRSMSDSTVLEIDHPLSTVVAHGPQGPVRLALRGFASDLLEQNGPLPQSLFSRGALGCHPWGRYWAYVDADGDVLYGVKLAG
jgi:hypothetical protein